MHGSSNLKLMGRPRKTLSDDKKYPPKTEKKLEEIIEDVKKMAEEVSPKVKPIEQLFNAVVGIPLQTSPEASTVVEKSSNGETSTLPVGADRVGSVAQKESSALSAGLTRKKYITVIVELLNAGETRRDWVKDGEEEGRWVETFVPNLDKRAKGAELAGKFFNDYREQVVTTGNVYNKVVYQWLSAPSAGVVANRI